MIPPSAIPNPSAAPSRRWRFSLPSWQFTLQETLGISLAMRKPSLHLTLPLIVSTLAAAAAYAFLPTRKRYHPGQVAVITGGSRGLGLALAHRFGRAGLKLVLAARDADELELARDRILRSRDVLEEDNILLVACDLTDPEQAKALIRSTMEAFGRLDLLVNNAGIIEVGPFENQPLEAYERAMQTNFFAALYTIHAALPYLLDPVDSAEQSCRGIVNIASIGGKIPVPHLLPYVAAKFALTGFSEGLHIEMRHKGVRVTTVCPGLMRTGGEEHAHFAGQQEKEARWFKLSARTPGLSASVGYAANRIFHAVQAGRAEITITPQAWLAARIVGLAPETSQLLASLANEYALPDPVYPAPGIPPGTAVHTP
jgi:NAD(P)-dependent dehydrogenase (short-subunit alcohol dehydrogenase family)